MTEPTRTEYYPLSLHDALPISTGKHTAWGYCHVPHGSQEDMTTAIENQIEKVAPGFRDTILARTTHHTADLEAFNPNLDRKSTRLNSITSASRMPSSA